MTSESSTPHTPSPDKQLIVYQPWSPEEELLLKRWGKETNVFSDMHTRATIYYSKFNKYLSIPSMIINTTLSSAVLGNSKYLETEYILFIVGVLLVVSNILKSLTDFYFKTQEYYTAHQYASREYRKLHNKISEQLVLKSVDREPSKVFIEYVRKKIDALCSEAPELPEHIFKKYHPDNQLERVESMVVRHENV